MTYAAVPALRADKAIAKEWTPRLASTSYDFGLRPAAATRPAALAGMGMTEKQGGSDVRANVTTATPTAADGEYTLDGHKWFTSAPDERRVPGAGAGRRTASPASWCPGCSPTAAATGSTSYGSRTSWGTGRTRPRSWSSRGTWGQRLGDEGRGVRTIIEMVAATRLDCVLGSASLMRRALAEASWHVAHRSAFGGLLADKPLMQNVVADLAVESEAATALAMRLAAAVDAADDPHEAALRRIALPLAKYWVCKRTPMMVAEALECLGGNGYVEESGMPLLFRESPLNSIWEGSGNVNALDVLRALSREPEALNAWIVEVGRARGDDPRLDRAIEDGPGVAGRRRVASRSAPAGSPGRWRPACRVRCSCSTPPPRSRTRSAPPGSAPGTAARSAPSPAASTWTVRIVARTHARRRSMRPTVRVACGRQHVQPLDVEAAGRSGQLEAGVERVLVEHLGRGAPWSGRRRRRPGCTSPWTASPPWCCSGWCSTARRRPARRPCRTRRARSRGWSGRGCRTGCRRCTRRRSGPTGTELRLVTTPGVEQRRLRLPAGEPERRHVEQHDVVVGAAGDQRRAPRVRKPSASDLALSAMFWA